MAILSPRMAVTNHRGALGINPLQPSIPPVPSVPCRLVTRSSKPPQTTRQEGNGTTVSQSFPRVGKNPVPGTFLIGPRLGWGFLALGNSKEQMFQAGFLGFRAL